MYARYACKATLRTRVEQFSPPPPPVWTGRETKARDGKRGETERANRNCWMPNSRLPHVPFDVPIVARCSRAAPFEIDSYGSGRGGGKKAGLPNDYDVYGPVAVGVLSLSLPFAGTGGQRLLACAGLLLTHVRWVFLWGRV